MKINIKALKKIILTSIIAGLLLVLLNLFIMIEQEHVIIGYLIINSFILKGILFGFVSIVLTSYFYNKTKLIYLDKKLSNIIFIIWAGIIYGLFFGILKIIDSTWLLWDQIIISAIVGYTIMCLSMIITTVKLPKVKLE